MTTKIQEAMIHLTQQLRSDEALWTAWKANIAMAFVDEYNRNRERDRTETLDIHGIANEAAQYFLTNLTRGTTPLEHAATRHMHDNGGPADLCHNCRAFKYASFLEGARQFKEMMRQAFWTKIDHYNSHATIELQEMLDLGDKP